MIRNIKIALALAALAFTVGSLPKVARSRKLKPRPSKQALSTATCTRLQAAPPIYQEKDGKLVLRLTNFKTSNGPDVHVILIAAKDADDNANFLKSDTERVELGSLKGNEGDQNYEIPNGTDLSKFQTVSIYCERFNANFGAAPLEKF